MKTLLTYGHILYMMYIHTLLQETVVLQMDGHQLIERTQKQYPKKTHPVNTITHYCTHLF